MSSHVYRLCDYELEALLEALRRDVRIETKFGLADPQWREFHLMNARMSKRLLEALNPKAAKKVHEALNPRLMGVR